MLVCVTVTLALTSGPAATDDDLEVVRRAVAQDRASDRSSAETATTAPATARKGAPPLWLRVRVVEKGGGKARVSVKLPLAIIHAFGDDWPIDWRCHSRRGEDQGKRCSIRLAEAIRTLESGESVVEVDDAEASVRVWVE
jgi:hypothetical protein